MSSDVTYLYCDSSLAEPGFDQLNDFTVRLNPRLNFDFSSVECALFKCEYPNRFQNIQDGRIKFYSFEHQSMVVGNIPVGYYRATGGLEFTRLWNRVLGDEDSKKYKLGWPTNSRFQLTLSEPECYLKLSPNLQAFMSFPKAEFEGEEKVEARYNPDPYAGHTSLKILAPCLVRGTRYGPHSEPSLAEVPFNPRGDNSGSTVYEPVHPLFTECYSRFIDQIRIQVQDGIYGDPFQFAPGSTACVKVLLGFRPKV